MHQILLGTTKGLCIYEVEDSTLRLVSVQFKGLPVSLLYFDSIHETYWVGLSMKHWGPKLFRSKDCRQWEEVAAPLYPEDSYINTGKPATLRLIWSGYYHPSQKKLWIGTEPGGLFESTDYGYSFQLNHSLCQLKSVNRIPIQSGSRIIVGYL
ncbi:MAG: hypothetical protein IPL46_17880 [Saprospiraceae bacterium]|nr:hypothetical protein [Saprospiraceae bacterium]